MLWCNCGRLMPDLHMLIRQSSFLLCGHYLFDLLYFLQLIRNNLITLVIHETQKRNYKRLYPKANPQIKPKKLAKNKRDSLTKVCNAL